MPRKNIPDAKNRILQAAIKVFSEKSFEGSRIEEIAREAQVPKSLIYYHFAGKNEILETLMQGFLREYKELMQVAENDIHKTKASEMPQRLQHHYRDFALKNADLIRIMLIDSLKKTAERPLVFQVAEAMVDTEEKVAVAEKTSKHDRNERLIAEFFTGIMPLYAYLCFSDSWVRYFDIDKRQFDELFLNIITVTHGAYHQNKEREEAKET
jgi:AcrR family transcriptional regulator